MIILLSPSKTLDFASEDDGSDATKPVFAKEAGQLIEVMREQSPAQIKNLMSVSDQLAEKTVDQYRTWRKKYNAIGAKRAIFAYQGDVYNGLQANQLTSRDLEFAQQHLRILSGLYGMLRPLDLIQPYRLEMGTKIKTAESKDLYGFWTERLTRRLRRLLSDQPSRLIVNLASAEYSQAIDFRKLNARVITPTFQEEKDGKLRFLSFFGKAARGMMANYLICNQVQDEDGVFGFDLEGYSWNEAASEDDRPVFSRPQKQPA